MEKVNQKTWLIFFLIITILSLFLNTMNDELSSVCGSPVTPFKDEHCGDAGHGYKNAYGEWEGGTLMDIDWDIPLEPLALSYPWLLKHGGLVHDLDVEHWVFGIIINMHVIDPPIYEKILRVLLWFAHIPYWLLLSYLLTKLWYAGKYAGKITVFLLFGIETFLFWYLLIFGIIDVARTIYISAQ